MTYDQFGQKILLVKDEQEKQALTGIECIKKNIRSLESIEAMIGTSFGPRGSDKIFMSEDGDIMVTNDGATIMSHIDLRGDPIGRLLKQLSSAQDKEIGDGTTGIVVLVLGLLREAEKLLDLGIRAQKIAHEFEEVLEIAMEFLYREARDYLIDSEDCAAYREKNYDVLRHIAENSLKSKIVSKNISTFAQVAVDAVLNVVDYKRKDVDFELISIETKTGGDLSETSFLDGIVLEKEFSHPQMQKKHRNVKVAILTCPFEPPKLKTSHNLYVRSVEDYKQLEEYERRTFLDMINLVKNSGAEIVFCQWGFDDEANYLLLECGIPAVRWVGGSEIERLAVQTNAQIVARFEDLSPQSLGFAESVEEQVLGTTGDRVIIVKGDPKTSLHTSTILVRGTNKMTMEEAKRSLEDAMFSIRNFVRDPRIVFGGGAFEIACCSYLKKQALLHPEKSIFIMAFANALRRIPFVLLKNAEVKNPLEALEKITAVQEELQDSAQGVDCTTGACCNMLLAHVYDPLLMKENQLSNATLLAKMIIKIDEVIIGN